MINSNGGKAQSQVKFPLATNGIFGQQKIQAKDWIFGMQSQKRDLDIQAWLKQKPQNFVSVSETKI